MKMSDFELWNILNYKILFCIVMKITFKSDCLFHILYLLLLKGYFGNYVHEKITRFWLAENILI